MACLVALVRTGSAAVWLDGCYATIAAGAFVRRGGASSAVRGALATAVVAAAAMHGEIGGRALVVHAGLMLAMALLLAAYVEDRRRSDQRVRDAVAAATTQAERAAAVIDVAGEFTASLDLGHVLARFAERTRGLFDAASIELSWLDLSRDALVMLVEWIDGAPVVTTGGGTVYALADYPLTRRVLVEQRVAQVRVSDPEAPAGNAPSWRSSAWARCS